MNGYFTGQTAPDQALMMGPCAQGYHIPTHAEWYDTIKLLWPSSGVGNTLAATLKLPLAGFRDYNYGYFDGQGTYGRYWTSKPAYQGPPAYDDEEFFAYFVELYKDNPVYRSTYHSASRAFGLSVRCIAN